ncbi:MAG: cytosine permease [Thermoleophilia bacterium]|nr:cytosine permease [Thermoleophilia bacterium]
MRVSEGSWGVTPVPGRLRTLSALDLTLLWANLGVSLLVVVTAALIVPALSLSHALAAIAVGSLAGNLMLASAGLIGADARVPAMVLLRAPLGRHGSYAATGLNVLQCLGWATFEIIVIAAAATALSNELFGVGANAVWTLVTGVVALVLALMGPVGVVRRVIRKFAVWIVLASLLYLSWWAVAEADLRALWHAPGRGGTSFVLAVDLVVAITVSWIPLAPDYTRFAVDRRAAFLGTGAGYFVAGTWMLALGAVLALARGIEDAAELPVAVASAGAASGLALLAVTVDEADEAFANIYSTAVSLQNVLARVPQRALVAVVAVLATAGALVLDLGRYQTFLLLLGSFFVPLFGVLFADWLLTGRKYEGHDFFARPPFRPGLVAAWFAGFALYQWLNPLGPGWWTSLVERTNPPEAQIGSSLPSFALAFGLAALAVIIARRARPASAPA